MKSKYKLKIKEISMRLKNGSVLLLGILCLFAFAPVASATDWTDPTCAAPGCNTNGPVWVSPGVPQTGYVNLTYSNVDAKDVIKIDDTRTTTTSTASLYVTSSVQDKPAIQGSSTGSTEYSYGGYFSATAAPGLYVTSGVVVEPLASNPTDYEAEGLLYLNSGSNQFRYYGDSAWRILNPFLTADADVDGDTNNDADGFHELYYSVAAGPQRGVAIKNSADTDLTPNDDYTLDVVRKSQSTSDRTVNGYLQAVGDTTYANGALGAYDANGYMVGVKGSASGTGAVTNYGGYFTAAGDSVSTAGVYGLSTGTEGSGVYGLSTSTSANWHYGGRFQASSGGLGVGVSGYGYAYGGYFEHSGSPGAAIRAVGTGDAASYSILVQEGAIALSPITTLPNPNATLGFVYIDSSDSKLYYQDENNDKYDLTSGSGTIADGDTDGQMSFWNDTAKEWQNTETNEMVWNDTNKNLVIGTVAPSTTNRLEVVNTGTANNSTGVMGQASTTTDGVTNYGGFFSASSTGAGSTGIGVKGAGNSIGGDFVSTGTGSYALRAETYAGVNNTVGGYFRVQGTGAKGVYGIATASDGIGVQGQSSGTGVTYGVYGNNTGVGNTGAGVYGTNSSSSGYGVEGVATATGAVTNYGGHFESAGNSGRGVYGSATATGAVTNYGGYFTAAGDTAQGVYGGVAGDNTIGVYGNSSGNSGKGVVGWATNTGIVSNIGGMFLADGQVGIGVYGVSNNSTGENYGGYFAAGGGSGAAVSGIASSTDAINVHTGGSFRAPNGAGRGLYASGFMESARFETSEVVISDGSDAIGYATGAGDLYVGDTLEVDGLIYSPLFYATGNGTVSAPTFTWSGDTNTGIYHDASLADVFYLTTGGIARATIDSNGVRSSVNLYSDNNLYINYDQDDTYATILFGTLGSTSAEYIQYSPTVDQFLVSGIIAQVNAGSAAAPSYTWSTDSDTGMYRGTNTISFSTGGTENLRLASNQVQAYASDTVTFPAYTWVGDTDTGMYHPAANTIGFTTAGAATARLTISSTGTLTAPVVYSTTVGTTYRDLYIDNTGLMGYLSSSLRYKDNVQDMEDISWLYALRPVNFTYKNDEGKAKQYGLIAEEVEKVNPLFVSYDEEGLPETVSYSALVTPMLEAIQTQKQQLDALETKVEMIEEDGCANIDAELMEYIKQLEARLEALEAEKAEPVKTSFWSKLW